MNNDRELLQRALDALNALTKELLACRDELAERGARPETPHKQKLWDSAFNAYTGMAIPTYEAIRARLAQPEPEPLAWMYSITGALFDICPPDADAGEFLPLYTAPPQREWVGLTDEEAKKTFEKHNCTISADVAGILARAITAKLKDKNT